MAFYGTVRLARAWCDDCKQMALVVRQQLQCCDRRLGRDEPDPVDAVRMSTTVGARGRPSVETKRRLLEEYNGCCAYCGRMLGSRVNYKGRVVKLKLQWDHNVPWSYAQDNSQTNFLPACHKCNGWKSNLIFATIDAIRVYVLGKWTAGTAKADADREV